MIAPLVLDVLKAAAILMLVRIGVSDFLTQKIRNEHITQLFVVAVAILLIGFVNDRDSLSVGLAMAMAAALFVVLLVFWLLGKVGAGDVKLLTTIPILLGYSASLPFVCLLLAFTLITFFVMKFPLVLPERWFRTYVASLAENGQVPFGVPIAAAAIVVVILPVNLLGTLQEPPARSLQACSSLSLGGGDIAAAMRRGFC